MEFQTVKGIIVATLTPFQEDGRIDWEALDGLNDFLVEKGVHGLFPCGSTGEGVFMDIEERKAVALRTVRRVEGKLPVVIHTGTLRTGDAVELTKHAQEIGAAGAALIPPYYYKMDNACLLEYYRAVARSTPDFPIYVYNIPSNVTNVIGPEVLAKLQKAIQTGLADPAIRQKLEAAGTPPAKGNESLAQVMRTDMDKYVELVKFARITADN